MKMTAANQIAQTIISEPYFLKLYKACVERSVLHTLNINTEEKYNGKEFRDFLTSSLGHPTQILEGNSG